MGGKGLMKGEKGGGSWLWGSGGCGRWCGGGGGGPRGIWGLCGVEVGMLVDVFSSSDLLMVVWRDGRRGKRVG